MHAKIQPRQAEATQSPESTADQDTSKNDTTGMPSSSSAVAPSTTTRNAPMKSWDHFLRSVVAGGLASTIAKTVVAPGERVRLILQTKSLFDGRGASAPHSTAQPARLGTLIRDIARADGGGILSFWKGNLANCLRSFPNYALRFSVFDEMREAAGPEFRASFVGALTLGALSGAITAVVTYPLDLVRTKLAVDSEITHGQKHRYRGMVHCAVSTARQGGIPALYQGLGISVIEIMPYTAILLGGYDLAKSHFPKVGDANASALSKLGVGWAVGLLASLVCYPIDTVKRHVMLQGSFENNGQAHAPQSRGIGRAIHQIFESHGFRGFYRGCLVNSVKSAPAAALTLVAHDRLKVALGI